MLLSLEVVVRIQHKNVGSLFLHQGRKNPFLEKRTRGETGDIKSLMRCVSMESENPLLNLR